MPGYGRHAHRRIISPSTPWSPPAAVGAASQAEQQASALRFDLLPVRSPRGSIPSGSIPCGLIPYGPILADQRSSATTGARVEVHFIMHFRVFYLINRSGECVSSISAVTMSARTICEQMLDRLQSEDDYLGIIDTSDTTLQVLPEPDQRRYYVEVPIEAAKASYGRYVDRAELDTLIRTLPPTFSEKTIPGLTYRPW